MAEQTGHIEAGGVRYFYRRTGTGEPLLLLHGGLGSGDMFEPILPALAAGREVIAVDMQGHGRTALGQRPFSLPAMGDDMATIVEALGFAEVDAMGYSMGAGVVFQFAIRHPERVRRLVLVSAGYATDGFYPEMLGQQAQMGAGMADFMKQTPMYQSYIAVAPNPDEFPKLLDAMGDWMRAPFDWGADIAKLTMPVMLVFGDSDMFRLEHVVDFYKKLGGGLRDAGWQREHMATNRLAILPRQTHYDIFLAPQLAATALPFLNGEQATRDWAA